MTEAAAHDAADARHKRAFEHSPFFIVGCGRSGTSLLRSMLNSHPDVSVPPEALSLIDFLRADRVPTRRLLRQFLRDHELREWGLRLTERDLAGCHSAAEMIDRVHRLYCDARGTTRWGHKTPRFVRYLDLLLESFPRARFIHIIRDPRAVARSATRSPIHRSNPLYSAIRWQRDVSAGKAFTEAHPDACLEVRYEALVRDPGGTLRSVCGFLELRFAPEMLRYPESAASEMGRYLSASHARLAGLPDPSRVDAWRDELDDRSIRVIESVAEDAMDSCGYPKLSNGRSTPGDRVRYRAQRVIGLSGQITHSLATRGLFLPRFVVRKWKLGLLADLRNIND